MKTEINTHAKTIIIPDLLTNDNLNYSFSKYGGIIVMGSFFDEYNPKNRGNVQATMDLLIEKFKEVGIQNLQIEQRSTDRGKTEYIYIYADTVTRLMLSKLNK